MNPPASLVLDQLPHRPPFRFISALKSLQPSVRGEAVWSVSGNEDFLAGHFPGNPIVPGVLIVEALAQLCGLVAAGASQGLTEGRLAHVDVRFHQPVIPPADIELRSRLQRTLGRLVLCEVEASTPTGVCARGELTLAFSPG